jgi:hypothetical protein
VSTSPGHEGAVWMSDAGKFKLFDSLDDAFDLAIAVLDLGCWHVEADTIDPGEWFPERGLVREYFAPGGVADRDRLELERMPGS